MLSTRRVYVWLWNLGLVLAISVVSWLRSRVDWDMCNRRDFLRSSLQCRSTCNYKHSTRSRWRQAGHWVVGGVCCWQGDRCGRIQFDLRVVQIVVLGSWFLDLKNMAIDLWVWFVLVAWTDDLIVAYPWWDGVPFDHFKRRVIVMVLLGRWRCWDAKRPLDVLLLFCNGRDRSFIPVEVFCLGGTTQFWLYRLLHSIWGPYWLLLVDRLHRFLFSYQYRFLNRLYLLGYLHIVVHNVGIWFSVVRL